jgi:hypothetical protein
MKELFSHVKEFFKKEALLESIIHVFIYAVVVSVLFSYLNRIDKFGSFFEISMVSATLGGFLFVGGLVQQKENSVLKKFIRHIGRQFLTSAVCFAILGVTVPAFTIVSKQTELFQYWFYYTVNIVFLLIAGINFANAVANVLLYLWIRRKDKQF